MQEKIGGGVLGSLQTGLPTATKDDGVKKLKTARRERVFRRLDLEIEKADCDRLDELKVALGVRSISDVIRQALRVHFYLITQIRNGYEIQLTHETTKKQITVQLL